MSTGSGNMMTGKVLMHKSDYRSGENCSLLYFRGKLLVRTESVKPKPFVIVDPETLKVEKDSKKKKQVDFSLQLRWKIHLSISLKKNKGKSFLLYSL